jgi:hypothetical protein
MKPAAGLVHLHQIDAREGRPPRTALRVPRPSACDHLRDGLDVGRGRPAAAADQVEPAEVHEPLERGSERGRRFQVPQLVVGDACVRVARDVGRGHFVDGAEVVGHEFGAGRAVEAHGRQAPVADRGIEGVCRLPREHRAHPLDRSRHHHRDRRAEVALERVEGQQRRLNVPRILRRLDENQVHAAVDERLRLQVVARAQRLEVHVARDGDGPRRRPHGARDPARPAGGGVLVGGRARQRRRLIVDVVRLGLEAELAEGDRVAVEGVGLDDVGAGLEVGRVHRVDDARIRPGDVVRAVLQVRAAVVLDPHPRLQDAPHGAVEHDDAGGERLEERLAAEEVHGCYT